MRGPGVGASPATRLERSRSWCMVVPADKGRIEDLRHQAERARRLAAALIGDEDRRRLLRHAEELEEMAMQLEKQGHGKSAG